ncbi:MAG: alternative oxidase, partial [Oceanicaulis sp.]
DVVIKVREDEAGHRDVNHRFADALTKGAAQGAGAKAQV